MTDLIICLMVTTFFPFVAKAPLAFAMHRDGSYDNRLPRLQQQRLEGFGARANAAHYNCFEALACFAPAVLVVLATNSITQTAVYAAYVFVVARVVYLLCYWFDIHVLRSSSWLIAMGAIVTLFLQAL
jgi:uncharacterized MAPEG superfamily protein